MSFTLGFPPTQMTILKRAVRIVCSAAAATAIVLACRVPPNIHLAAPSVLLLLAVLVISSRWDFWEGVAATVCGDLLLGLFFMPPQKEWWLNSAQYWIVFITFLVVGIATAHVAARAKRLTLDALSRNQELEQLYAWSRGLSLDTRPEAMTARLLDSLVRLFRLETAVFYNTSSGQVLRAGIHDDSIALDELQRHGDQLFSDMATHSFFAPIRVERRVVGTLGVRGGKLSELAFRAIAERLESGLEKSLALEKATRAEAARRSQELKSAVLDSLIHDVKTPISVIKAAVSSLLSTVSSSAPGRELLDIVNEEVDRLDACVNEVFWTAYIDAGMLEPSKELHDIQTLINRTLKELHSDVRARPVKVEMSEPSPQATFDFPMIKGVLKELLRNALKYSEPRSPLTIAVNQNGQEVIITVTDRGVGVPPEEQTRIFKKHYRGNVKAPGTGLGLAIAKTIVEAHGGTIGVASGPEGGASFYFSLPTSLEEVA